MVMRPRTDVASHLSVAKGPFAQDGSGNPILIVANSANDNVARNGANIDRDDFDMPLSAAIQVAWATVLAATQTLSLRVSIQEADDDGAGNPGSYGAAEIISPLAVVATGAGTFSGVLEVPLGLKKRKRHFRVVVLADLSAATADTALYATSVAMGGNDTLPAV